MTPSFDHLLARIEALLDRALALPDAEAAWEQRLHLDFELLLLFRQIADLADGPRPYWMIPDLGLSPRNASGPDDADSTYDPHRS